jgi:hypothetical protein
MSIYVAIAFILMIMLNSTIFYLHVLTFSIINSLDIFIVRTRSDQYQSTKSIRINQSIGRAQSPDT